MKKEKLLIVVGMLVLIIALFGITYAFFQYSRTGATNNQITSGKLLVSYDEVGNELEIYNAYPISDAAGVQSTQYTFTVSGYATGSTTISYNVYAVLGNTETGRTRLRDYEVKMHLVGTVTNGSGSINVRNNYNSNTGAIIGANNTVKATDDLIIASGVISSHNPSSQEVHTYALQLWISDDHVSIGETSSTDGTDSVYSSSDFENLYYSLKINVRATA